MRTTIDLPPDLHDAARAIARDRGTTLSATVAELLRRGLGQPSKVEFGRSEVTGLPTFSVGWPITDEDVRSLDDDE